MMKIKTKSLSRTYSEAESRSEIFFSFVTDLNGALCLFRLMLMDVIAGLDPGQGSLAS